MKREKQAELNTIKLKKAVMWSHKKINRIGPNSV